MLGYLLVSSLSLPIPAAVLGLVLLFVFLLVHGHVSDSLIKVTSTILPLLPLFLIPASAGIIQHGGLLQADGVAIATALIVSLLMSILVIPFIFMFFIRLFRKN
jgi:holin-like protein